MSDDGTSEKKNKKNATLSIDLGMMMIWGWRNDDGDTTKFHRKLIKFLSVIRINFFSNETLSL